MALRSANLVVMTKAAEKAGKALLRDFGEVEQLQVSNKGPADFVSNADTKSEQIIRDELSRARPAYGIMAEESTTEKPDTEFTFIIDPLDGTSNFLHGIPHWAISIGLAKGDQMVAGVVYEPIRDEMFWCEKGSGAFLNANRLRVSGRQRLENSLIATGIPFKGHESPEFMTELQAIAPKVAGIRRMGAASLDLAYVAAGRYDAYWERNLKAWDAAAGACLVMEAGGSISPFKRNENPVFSGNLLASNQHLHKQLCDLLGAAYTII
jgi:myo-inositol-1(or 4)-monophosphatase